MIVVRGGRGGDADARTINKRHGPPSGREICDAMKGATVATVSYNFPMPGGAVPG
jgi:hypothetical protein